MKKILFIPLLFVCCLGISQSSVIGKPIFLQKFAIAQYQFIEEMNWKDAKAACAKLGNGWRLPTADELKVMYKYKDKIGNFNERLYWSSTGGVMDFGGAGYFPDKIEGIRFQFFTIYVRAVKSL
jgi:hypothetical protein